jgi:hypothetical protein
MGGREDKARKGGLKTEEDVGEKGNKSRGEGVGSINVFHS